MSKLMQKARDLRCYMIIYMFFMTLMQVLAHLHKPIRWQILALFLTSVPGWIIYIKYGYADLMSEMFSLNGYDVYVNGVKSEEKKDEMQRDLDAANLILVLIISVFGIITTGILILFMTIKLLVKGLYFSRRDKILSQYLLKSVGISWAIAAVTYILLVIFINVV